MPSNNKFQKLVHVTQATAEEFPGRREYFTYRDLGVNEGSSGTLNAQTMRAVKGMTQPTGWHYHECDGQFLFILNGWIDMEFETGDEIHLEKGHSIFFQVACVTMKRQPPMTWNYSKFRCRVLWV